jgi:DNA sulfur modification protein DndB
MQIASNLPKAEIRIPGIIGVCGRREVFMAFAPANLLHSMSFADVLNEHTGEGYQRKFNKKHSADFRKYIRTAFASTIPLTFNLRPESQQAWRFEKASDGSTCLVVAAGNTRVLSQVDCQHRLGSLGDLEIPLAFMTFIGLPLKEEMSIFNVINSKAKGLNASLLDYHETKLLGNIATEKPELFIAIKMNDDEGSPWFKQLDLGGTRIIGLSRRASLRTMQSATKRFLRKSGILTGPQKRTVEEAYSVLNAFWTSVTNLLKEAWQNPRKHFVTKGIGVYALNELAADLYREALSASNTPDQTYFSRVLAPFICDIDWSHAGPLKGFGGRGGAAEAYEFISRKRDNKTT